MKEENKSAEQEIEIVKEKAQGMEKMLESFQVSNDEELGIVTDKIKDVKTLKKFIEQKKEAYTEPAKAIIAKAREDFDPWIKKCENAEITLKERAKRYMIAKEEKRQKEEAKIAAKVEAGKLKPETAVKKMEALPETSKTVSTDKGSTLRMSKRLVAMVVEVENQRKVLKSIIESAPSQWTAKLAPSDYWIIDEVRLRRDALALHKANQPIPTGTEIKEETDIASL